MSGDVPEAGAAGPAILAADDTGDDPGERPRPVRKSATAYRTISEVSEDLEVPQHVLRFWETKFSQVRPLKRGGGRRYYRPEDVALLRRIQTLLYQDGYTIKGVQRLLREGRGETAGPAAVPQAPGGEAATDELPFEADRGPAPAAPEAPADAGAGGLSPSVRAELEGLLAELHRFRRLLAGGEPAPKRGGRR